MEITLENVLSVLRKYLILILVVALVAGICAFFVSNYLIAPTYVSTAKMNLVVPPELLKTYSEGNAAWVYANRQVVTCVETLQSNNFKRLVREHAAIDHWPNLAISYNENSTIITIKALDSSPADAYNVALAVSELSSDFIKEKNLAILTLTVVDSPEQSTQQVAPSPMRNVIISAVAAALIVYIIEFLRETLGTKIKGENELSKHYELPVIAVIPDFNAAARGGSYYYYYEYKQYGKKEGTENGEK